MSAPIATTAEDAATLGSAFLYVECAFQVTPHPTRAGWQKRRTRATLSPRERAVISDV